MSVASLPPGPPSRLLNTLSYLDDPVAALNQWRGRYGDTFTVRDLSATTVVTCDPALIRALLCTADSGNFGAVLPQSFDVLLGRRSLLLLPGDEHRDERKRLTAPLCRAAVPKWVDTIAAAARGAFAGLEAAAPFVALERMREVTSESTSKILFGPSDPGEPALRAAAREVVRLVHPSFLLTRLAQLDLGRLNRFGRYMAASRELDRLILARIARGRAKSEHEGSIISLLLRIHADDEDVRDQVRTLLVGGQETTSVTLAWSLYYLHRERELLARARAELDALPDPSALARAPLLDAIIDETLRIRPPAGQCYRTLRAPFQLGSWTLPARVIVSFAPCLLHHRPQLWPQPDRFDPDRFRGRERPSPASYLPFGGGRRRCIGASLGKLMAAVVLGTLVRELELELELEDEPAWGRDGIALSPKPGVRMRLVGRRPTRSRTSPARTLRGDQLESSSA